MKYVILGASAAGINAAKTIRELDSNGEIVVISKDNKVYSRCILHHVISGHREVEEISFIEKDFFEKYNIHWLKKTEILDIDIDNKNVILDNKNSESFDKLLIAAGSNAFIPPVKNLREANEVYPLRNIEDAINISKAEKDKTNVVIIGAGLVGIDAAVGLLEKGIKIHIVEMADRILPLQLDRKAAENYEKLFSGKGVSIHTSVSLQQAIVDEENKVKAVKLSNDEEIECNMIVAATGVRPNVNFINDDRIKIDRGIVVNNKCETTQQDIYAAGDVCGKSPIWPIAVKQGINAAYNMVSKEKILDDNFALRNSMNFLGLDTVSLGLIQAPDDSYTVDVLQLKNVYKKIIHKEGIIYGALFQGDISYCGVFTYIIKNKINISHIDKNIFEIDYSDFYSIKENGQYEYSY